ncbi:Conserved_hypothetical protein [Hexamita inflata]|uniref:Uncharacterized protein n=1 Tax=Hexamita inflata TaxID=28002 RepID=A0AA86Q118_9EUKA|nr:Conserved hypothetical protein [Hexamita inflata]
MSELISLIKSMSLSELQLKALDMQQEAQRIDQELQKTVDLNLQQFKSGFQPLLVLQNNLAQTISVLDQTMQHSSAINENLQKVNQQLKNSKTQVKDSIIQQRKLQVIQSYKNISVVLQFSKSAKEVLQSLEAVKIIFDAEIASPSFELRKYTEENKKSLQQYIQAQQQLFTKSFDLQILLSLQSLGVSTLFLQSLVVNMLPHYLGKNPSLSDFLLLSDRLYSILRFKSVYSPIVPMYLSQQQPTESQLQNLIYQFQREDEIQPNNVYSNYAKLIPPLKMNQIIKDNEPQINVIVQLIVRFVQNKLISETQKQLNKITEQMNKRQPFQARIANLLLNMNLVNAEDEIELLNLYNNTTQKFKEEFNTFKNIQLNVSQIKEELKILYKECTINIFKEMMPENQFYPEILSCHILSTIFKLNVDDELKDIFKNVIGKLNVTDNVQQFCKQTQEISCGIIKLFSILKFKENTQKSQKEIIIEEITTYFNKQNTNLRTYLTNPTSYNCQIRQLVEGMKAVEMENKTVQNNMAKISQSIVQQFITQHTQFFTQVESKDALRVFMSLLILIIVCQIQQIQLTIDVSNIKWELFTLQYQ